MFLYIVQIIKLGINEIINNTRNCKNNEGSLKNKKLNFPALCNIGKLLLHNEMIELHINKKIPILELKNMK
jgi:hypothetical protein